VSNLDNLALTRLFNFFDIDFDIITVADIVTGIGDGLINNGLGVGDTVEAAADAVNESRDILVEAVDDVVTKERSPGADFEVGIFAFNPLLIEFATFIVALDF